MRFLIVYAVIPHAKSGMAVGKTQGISVFAILSFGLGLAGILVAMTPKKRITLMTVAAILMAVVVGAMFIPPIAFWHAACAANQNYSFDIDIPIGNYVGTNEQGYILMFQVLAWDKATYDADPNHGIKHLHADEPTYQGQKYYGFVLEIKKDGETIHHQIGNYRYASVSRRVEYINTLWCDFSSPAFEIRGNGADIHFSKEGPQVYFACSCPTFGSAELNYLGA